MSFDSNKTDFERALKSMMDEVVNLRGVLHEDVLSTLEDVVSEYNGHYKDDIVSLVDEYTDLEDKYNQLVDEKDA